MAAGAWSGVKHRIRPIWPTPGWPSGPACTSSGHRLLPRRRLPPSVTALSADELAAVAVTEITDGTATRASARIIGYRSGPWPSPIRRSDPRGGVRSRHRRAISLHTHPNSARRADRRHPDRDKSRWTGPSSAHGRESGRVRPRHSAHGLPPQARGSGCLARSTPSARSATTTALSAEPLTRAGVRRAIIAERGHLDSCCSAWTSGSSTASSGTAAWGMTICSAPAWAPPLVSAGVRPRRPPARPRSPGWPAPIPRRSPGR